MRSFAARTVINDDGINGGRHGQSRLLGVGVNNTYSGVVGECGVVCSVSSMDDISETCRSALLRVCVCVRLGAKSKAKGGEEGATIATGLSDGEY